MTFSWDKKTFYFYIITIQEAFTAIVPFFLLSSIITLVYTLVNYFHIDFFIFNAGNLKIYMEVFRSFTSIAVVTSIAFFLARRSGLSEIITVFLALALFISFIILEQRPAYPLALPFGFTPATLVAPILSAILLDILYPKLSLGLPLNDPNKHIFRLFNYLAAFFVAYFIGFLIYAVSDYFMDRFLLEMGLYLGHLPRTAFFFVRDLLVQVFWYVGIHGSHMVNAILGKKILASTIVPGLDYGEFNRLFITMGGTGAGLSLLITLLIYARDKMLSFISRLSIPFVVFNINTLLVYVVIVLNRYLFVPFLIVPMFNFIAGYLFIRLVPMHFTSYHIPWTTPVFINGYLKTNGDWRLLSFQMFLIFIDTLIYSHYVKKYLRSRAISKQAEILQLNLNLAEDLKTEENIQAYIAQKEIIEAQAKLNELLPTLTEKNLLIYYQPKIDTKEFNCNKLEALLRYYDNGKIRGPFFLDIIEKARLASILDLWVTRRVRADLERWESEGFHPTVSINIHPDTLLDNRVVSLIIDELRGKNVIIEVVERSFLLGKDPLNNINRFRAAGFPIAIDDFGIAYSNVETIIKHDIYELKLDKTLIDTVETRNGYIVCKKIVEMCHEIGFLVVAEGVETEGQLRKLIEMGVDYIQGFYFAPALPPEEAKNYCLRKK